MNSAERIISAAPLTTTAARQSRPGRLMLATVALAAAMCLGGCGPSPELMTYREGLHAVDEPLYEAHLQLMDQAVVAGIRTDADRQTVKAGIQAARSLYQESRKPAN